MKRLGRKHRPYFRIVAIDSRQPRDGRVIEELGSYDPMIKNTDERVKLTPDRIKYWMSVGAKPSENVGSAHQEVHGEVRAGGGGAAEPAARREPPPTGRGAERGSEAAPHPDLARVKTPCVSTC